MGITVERTSGYCRNIFGFDKMGAKIQPVGDGLSSIVLP